MIEAARTLLASTALLGAGLALPGCDGGIEINGQKGVPLSEIEISGPPPSQVILSSSDTVIVTDGDIFDIQVEGAGAEGLRFVRDGEVIGVTRENNWTGPSGAVIRITMPPPREIVIAGSGSVQAQSLASNAEINVGGSGKVQFQRVAAEKLGINIGGAGSVQGTGTARTLEVLIGGSGDIIMPGLKADTAEVSIGGSGDVVFASDGTVEANIGGSGDVKVSGNAKCKLNSFGSGSLTCTPTGAGGAAAPAAPAG